MSISNAGLIQGWNDRVTQEPYEYGRWGNPNSVYVYDNGDYRPLQQGETVPAGTPISIYTSQTGTLSGAPTGGAGGVETTTGQDLTWQNHQIAMDLLSAQDRMRQLDQVDAQLQQSHEQFMASLQQQRQIAEANIKNDSARIGVSGAQVALNARLAEIDAQARAAQLNFEQRLSEVQQQREDAKVQLAAATERVQQEFNAASLNAQQRQEVASLEQNALQMLADRSGPQDWVRYGNLLEGLSGAEAGTPRSEINVDPLARLKDVYQEYTPDTSKLQEMEGYTTPGASSINQPWTAPSAGGAWEGILSGALGSRATGLGGGMPMASAPTSTRPAPGGGGGGGAPGGGIADGGGAQPPGPGEAGVPQQTTLLDEQPGGPSPGIANTGIEPGRNLITAPQGGGIAYDRWDPRLDIHYLNDQGNYTQLAPGQTAAGGEAVWVTAPNDWSPASNRLSPERQAQANAKYGGGFPGTVSPEDMSKYQNGGPFPGTVSPEDMNKYNMQPAARGAHINEGQIGYAGDSKSGKPTGHEEAVIPVGGSAIIVPHDETEAMRDGQMPGSQNQASRQAGAQQAQPPQEAALAQVSSILQQAMAMLRELGSSRPSEGGPTGIMQPMAGGGVVSDTVGAGDPNEFTYRLYDDETLYNQPFLRQIRGESPGRSFGNFGGGNTVGPWDLPSNLSIQRYSQLQPTAQKMLKGAYDDPETGLAFEDVLESARRASVGTRSAGGMSAYR